MKTLGQRKLLPIEDACRYARVYAEAAHPFLSSFSQSGRLLTPTHRKQCLAEIAGILGAEGSHDLDRHRLRLLHALIDTLPVVHEGFS